MLKICYMCLYYQTWVETETLLVFSYMQPLHFAYILSERHLSTNMQMHTHTEVAVVFFTSR